MTTEASTAAQSVDLLSYMRSKTSIDYDSLHLKVATELGPFADCTSNQWEAYSQLCDEQNAALLQESLADSRKLHGFVTISLEELAVEIAMIRLALRIVPFISGSIHVMCNPLYSWDTDKVFETGHRFHKICRFLDPAFDLSRLVMKVPSTWEGMQACSRLKADNIKTLATTVFTMEQVVLAGEAGCTSISPFAHELRAHLDAARYQDAEPVLGLIHQAQLYYKQHGISTKVKSCAFMTTDEVINLAGGDAMTLPAEVLEELSKMPGEKEDLEARSVFRTDSHNPTKQFERLSYIDDRVKFLRAFTANGKGKSKTEDAIAIFCGFQIQAEALVTKARNQTETLKDI